MRSLFATNVSIIITNFSLFAVSFLRFFFLAKIQRKFIFSFYDSVFTVY